jgi:hypothetical protein
MVKEYMTQFYLPAMQSENNGKAKKE